MFQFLSAQITFEKKYGKPGIYQCWGACAQQTEDTGYIAVGTIYPYNELTDLYLVKTTPYGDTVWTKRYGSVNAESGHYIQQTGDGGFIIAATKNRYQAGMKEFWLVKTDADGDTLWTKTFLPDYTNSEVAAKSVVETGNGDYVILGREYSVYGKNIFIVKVGANGDSLWTKEYYGVAHDIKKTYDGGLVICGGHFNYTDNRWDALLMKLNSTGDSLWAKTFSGTGMANSIQQTQDQGYIITGTTDTVSNTDVFLIKTDSQGNKLWTKTFGGEKIDEGNSICQTGNGEFVIAGNTWSFGEGLVNVYLIKTDVNGDTLWTKTFGYDGDIKTNGYSVRQSTDGGFIVCGQVEMLGADFLYLLKTDNNGSLSSVKLYHDNNARLLKSIYPNPVKTNATVNYHVPVNDLVTVNIYDVNGKNIITLVNEEKRRGDYKLNFNTSNIPDGSYFINVRVGGKYFETRKILISR